MAARRPAPAAFPLLTTAELMKKDPESEWKAQDGTDSEFSFLKCFDECVILF